MDLFDGFGGALAWNIVKFVIAPALGVLAAVAYGAFQLGKRARRP